MVGAGRVLTHPPGSLYLQRGLLHFLYAEAIHFRAHRRDVGAVARIVVVKGFAADRDLKRGDGRACGGL